MKERNELGEADAEKALAEERLGEARDALESKLPTTMTHEEMRRRNAGLWKQGGDQ